MFKKLFFLIIISSFIFIFPTTGNAISSSATQNYLNDGFAIQSQYDDEFNGPSLDLKWHWLREDSTRWSLTASPGNMRIIATGGDMVSYCGFTAKNVLLEDAPSGNFEIYSKVDINPTVDFQQAGILAFNDDHNYVKVAVAYNDGDYGGTAVEVLLIENGQLDRSQRPFIRINTEQPTYLKLVKDGSEYSGYYSQDGQTWNLVGTYATEIVTSPQVGMMAITSCFGYPPDIPADFDFFRVKALSCSIPFFSQRDDAWINHPLRGSCSGWCIDPKLGFVTIGRCGCALTSTAIVFNTYQANTDPPRLSDCLNNNACPISWGLAASACSQGKANWIRKTAFSYSLMDNELNVNHQPIILGMCKKGTCGTANEQPHWVVVLSGQGNDPEYYKINDPWYKCGVNIPLATRSADWEFKWLSIYQGVIPCSSLVVQTPPCVDRGAHPQPVKFSKINSIIPSEIDNSVSSIISGTVWIYTRTEITMTMEITASSSLSNITDMVMWSDTISNTNWQPFTPFVWMPVSDNVYVRFRDNLGNVSDVYSDSTNPNGPPEAPYFELYLPITRK